MEHAVANRSASFAVCTMLMAIAGSAAVVAALVIAGWPGLLLLPCWGSACFWYRGELARAIALAYNASAVVLSFATAGLVFRAEGKASDIAQLALLSVTLILLSLLLRLAKSHAWGAREMIGLAVALGLVIWAGVHWVQEFNRFGETTPPLESVFLFAVATANIEAFCFGRGRCAAWRVRLRRARHPRRVLFGILTAILATGAALGSVIRPRVVRYYAQKPAVQAFRAAGGAVGWSDWWVVSVGIGGRTAGKPPLAQLRHFPRLRELWLSQAEISDSDLSYVGDCLTLETLGLDRTPISDAGLCRLRNLTALRELCLADTRVTDEGLKNVVAWPHLAHLTLQNTAVTDAGLKQLYQLKDLRYLYFCLYSRPTVLRVSPKGISDLKNHLPGLRVQ